MSRVDLDGYPIEPGNSRAMSTAENLLERLDQRRIRARAKQFTLELVRDELLELAKQYANGIQVVIHDTKPAQMKMSTGVILTDETGKAVFVWCHNNYQANTIFVAWHQTMRS